MTTQICDARITRKIAELCAKREGPLSPLAAFEKFEILLAYVFFGAVSEIRANGQFFIVCETMFNFLSTEQFFIEQCCVSFFSSDVCLLVRLFYCSNNVCLVVQV